MTSEATAHFLGVLELDAHGVVTHARPAAPALMGRTIDAALRSADGSYFCRIEGLADVERVECRLFRDGGSRLELFGTPAPTAAPSQALLWAMTDANPHLISVVDAQHKYVFVNRACAAFIGSDEVATESSFDVAVLERDAQFTVPEVLTSGNGEQLRVETSKRRINLPNAEHLVLNVSVDTSSRQAAERALSETRDRLENAVAAGRIGLWDWDVAQKRMYFSPMWKWQLGFDDHEIENTFEAWSNLLHPDDRPRLLDALSEHLGNAATALLRIEFRLRTKGGDWRWLACSAITTRDGHGHALRMIGCNVDISETRTYEASLEASNAHLAHAAKLKDEFLANMSHELRTPLNAVLGQTEAMLEGIFGTIGDEQRTALELIDSSGRHLLSLINDVLDVAKLEAGRLETHFEPVGVEALCHESLALVRQRATNKKLELSYENRSGIEAVQGDRRRIKQVLLNLLSNAIKFTDAGSVSLEVTRHGRDVSFAVKDTGIGMNENDVGQLFEPFTQLESGLRRSHEGTGLGLALVKRLVELHKGTVRVLSEKGRGSTFTVSLPINDTLLPAPEPDANSANEPSETTLRTALIVDDNDMNVLPLRAFLRRHGVDVMVARGAEEAIHLIHERRPDVTFMDIQMPHIDGFEAMRRLRADPRTEHIAIIALTALAMTGDKEDCLAAGADGYLSKPVRLRDALAMAERIVTSRASAPLRSHSRQSAGT